MNQPKLIITAPNGTRREVSLTGEPITIGRSSSNDIALPDARVSRRHATISADGDCFTIRNESTSSPLHLNGQPVADSPLAAGDVITLGKHSLRLEVPQPVPIEADVVLNSKTDLERTLQQTVVDSVIVDTALDRLTIITPAHTWDIVLDDDMTVGRSSNNRVVLDLPKVSRQHAAIERRGDQFVLRDLGSSNGTLVNGIKVTHQPLRRGDTVQIGPAKLLFKPAFELNDLTVVGNALNTRPPIILIPGIMGSQLWRGSEQIWPRAHALYSKESRLILPDDGQVEARGIVEQVVIIPNFIKLGVYQPMRDLLVDGLGYELGNDLIEFAYDWRQDVRRAARTLAKIVDEWKQAEPITIIAHSLGSLLSRYFVECLGGKRHVGQLVLIGGPHLGSLQASKSLLSGPNIVPFGLFGDRLKQIIGTFPSMYQLLPRYPSVFETDGRRIDMLADDGWLNPIFKEMQLMAKDFRNELGTRSSVPVVSIFGYGQTTPDKIVVERNRDGRWKKTQLSYSTEGDGVVPTMSAILPNSEVHPVRQQHGTLFQDNDVKMRLRMALAPLPVELM